MLGGRVAGRLIVRLYNWHEPEDAAARMIVAVTAVFEYKIMFAIRVNPNEGQCVQYDNYWVEVLWYLSLLYIGGVPLKRLLIVARLNHLV